MKTCGLTIIFLMSVFSSVCAQEARVTVRVIDFHTGQPISNVVVNAGFDTNIKSGWGWGAGKPNAVMGITDTNGVCVLTGNGDGGSVGVAVTNTSVYYGNSCNVVFTNVTFGIIGKRWQPWNPKLELRVKKVGNPIPLFCKGVGGNTRIPVKGVPIGYDLLKGDWVEPYGKGKMDDLIFTYTNTPDKMVKTQYGDVKIYDCSLRVAVSRDGDGFIPVSVSPRDWKSNLRLPPVAPPSGYKALITKRVYRDAKELQHRSDIRDDLNYFIRIRTKKDEKGQLISALYGKIHRDFQVGQDGYFGFIYYLNPTPNDRNLEFDGKNNLFKPGWKDTDWPWEP